MPGSGGRPGLAGRARPAPQQSSSAAISQSPFLGSAHPGGTGEGYGVAERGGGAAVTQPTVRPTIFLRGVRSGTCPLFRNHFSAIRAHYAAAEPAAAGQRGRTLSHAPRTYHCPRRGAAAKKLIASFCVAGRLLAQAWLQYRYGVFEEEGVAGNPVHPPHHRAPDGSWRPTTCANLPLVPSANCDPANLSCPFSLKPENDPGLTSSFMAFPELPSVSTSLQWAVLSLLHDLRMFGLQHNASSSSRRRPAVSGWLPPRGEQRGAAWRVARSLKGAAVFSSVFIH